MWIDFTNHLTEGVIVVTSYWSKQRALLLLFFSSSSLLPLTSISSSSWLFFSFTHSSFFHFLPLSALLLLPSISFFTLLLASLSFQTSGASVFLSLSNFCWAWIFFLNSCFFAFSYLSFSQSSVALVSSLYSISSAPLLLLFLQFLLSFCNSWSSLGSSALLLLIFHFPFCSAHSSSKPCWFSSCAFFKFSSSTSFILGFLTFDNSPKTKALDLLCTDSLSLVVDPSVSK